MSSTAPKIDNRDQNGLALKIREYLVRYLPESWTGTDEVAADSQTDTLVQLFSRLVEIVNQRLNLVPDKHFLGFLEMLGIDLSPARAARTEIVFQPMPQATSAITIPAETQVSQAGGGKDPIVFETEESLVVLPYSINGVFVHNPKMDLYSDYSHLSDPTGSSKSAPVFTGTNAMKHRIYIGHEELLSSKDEVTVKLEVLLKEEILSTVNPWVVKWYIYSEDSEQPVLLEGVENDQDATDTLVPNLLKSGVIKIPSVKGVKSKKIGGYGSKATSGNWTEISAERRWIFAELSSPLSQEELDLLPLDESHLPEIQFMKMDTVIESEPKNIDFGLLNGRFLDVSKDFYPFDKKPEFNDTFYFAAADVLSIPGNWVNLKVLLHQSGLSDPETSNISLRYEFWDGKDWVLLGEATQNGTVDGGTYSFVDSTKAFTADKDTEHLIRFICPPIVSTKVNGKEGYYIRVRLTSGNYGKEASYENVNGSLVYVPATFQPPIISLFKISYSKDEQIDRTIPEMILLENNFQWLDVTQINAQNAVASTVCDECMIAPFVPSEETSPSFYISFDGPLANLPVNFLFSVPGGSLNLFQIIDTEDPPVLIWETWTDNGWEPVSVADNTEYFSRREAVHLLVHGSAVERPLFGKTGSWVRVRQHRGVFTQIPEVNKIYFNNVKASHRVTVRDEFLGSSNGEPDQVFRLSKLPVLDGQQVVVIEQNITTDEYKTIQEEEGLDAVKEVLDEAGKPLEVFVRWHEVNRFDFSSSSSRHYMIDRASGQITFGDGRNGMIPPDGRNNIICKYYQYGGGIRGNVKGDTLTRLRKSIPLIKSVSNPFAVAGGVDMEDLDDVRVRGPKSIKSRNRAVTVEDYETLVLQSSGEIARAHCLPTTDSDFQYRSGFVTMVIVPDTEDLRPTPSPELKALVEDYLSTRASTEIIHADDPQVIVMGSSYLRVDVKTVVHILNMGDAKEVQEQIRARLETFFHPLSGGDKGTGWDFGRNVYASEVYAVLEQLEGVDYVESVLLSATKQTHQIRAKYPFSVPATCPVESSVTFTGERVSPGGTLPVRITMRLAEEIAEDMTHTDFVVTGFQEDDSIIVSYSDGVAKPVEFTAHIESISGNRLILKENKFCERDFLAGLTTVRTHGGQVTSVLTKDLDSGTNISELEIAVVEESDEFEIVHRYSKLNRKKGLVDSLQERPEKIYLDPNYLTYSGAHEIIVKG